MSELHGLTFEKDDKLQRKVYAERLTNFLIANKEDVDVACINAPWGTGKTWFVHMWKNYITDEYSKNEDGTGIMPVYYNSWENDDYPNALIPLIAEIKTQLFPEKTGEAISKFAKASGAILKDAAYNALNLATAGLLDFRVGTEAANELSDEALYEKSITQYNTNTLEKKNFKDSLKAIIKDDIKKHVFVFVDELDRCRPTFAIETLERIKHYFDIEGITFILLLDKEQLSHSVKVLYGTECDTAGYLLRFFDIEYNLPEIGKSHYIDYIFDRQADFAFLVKPIEHLFELTLRDYQKISIWLRAFTMGIDKRWPPFERAEYQLIVYFMIIKLKHPEIFASKCNMNGIEYSALPKAEDVDSVCISKHGIDIVNIFIRGCNVANGHLNKEVYLKELEGAEKQKAQAFFLSYCEKVKCEKLFEALTFLGYFD